MMDWLFLPLGTNQAPELPASVYWHGRLMVLAWGFLVPIGVVTARFWKLWPGQQWPKRKDHKAWWHLHRSAQWVALLAATLGVYLLWSAFGGFRSLSPDPSKTAFAYWHGLGGLTLMSLAWLQVLGAYLRGSKGGPTEPQLRGDHFDMTPRRRFFERVHKTLGWALATGAAALIISGLYLSNAPLWMLLGILAWWGLLVALSIVWQRQGRCIDTYQAIWGNDPTLPGLRFKPIGLGVRRI